MCHVSYNEMLEAVNKLNKFKNTIVEIILPEYEFYIKKNNEWIPSNNYVRGKIIDELGIDAYKVKLFIKGEPEVVAHYEDLKWL